ncbi:nuclear transport factor 2 family protein [Nocardia sp. NEAU-G5]|uniref:Nuclear transport factor 2 family protein n=2 Tax=Nocardia albiluteola TaxID=2842303 RepID=A0ABS6B589_9NOCA|nr:nuclear transport factor 2 family protein [Nocardia albiluteola]MBU3065478.1 nuclear transport factor 2 family protein [Nocardia albiluteola]
MPELLHPDIVLTQPLAAPMRGLDAARAEFEGIWRLFPDLRAQIDRWSGDSELLFIEFRLRAHVGRELIEWPNIDRFVLRDGKAIVRTNYFDPLPVFGWVARHPSLWWRWWTSGVARPWRTGHTMADYTALPLPGGGLTR